jgi:hypothetical protein
MRKGEETRRQMVESIEIFSIDLSLAAFSLTVNLRRLFLSRVCLACPLILFQFAGRWLAVKPKQAYD